MKAKKQERLIAAATATLVAGSAVALFVSGLGGNKAGIGEEEETAHIAVSATESKEMETFDSSVVSISELTAYTVGSSAFGVIGRSEQGIEAAADEETDGAKEEPETEAETEPETEAEPETEPYKYENTFLANVNQYLNIRSTPSTDGAIVGKVYRGGGGEVLERGEEWSKVRSGNAEGYVSNKYVWFSYDAEAHMPEVCAKYGISEADCLRVRKGPGTNYDIITVVNTGTEVQISSIDNGWAKVDYVGTVGYISADYLSVGYYIQDGVTIEEEQEAIRLEQERIAAEKKKAAEAEAAKQQQIQQAVSNSALTQTVQTSSYNVSEQDAYLLACTVHAEAGYENYEGRLAVANIILNRLKSGIYGSTIYDVVYAKGQFAVVPNGALAKAIKNGPNEGSLQAAKDALAGKNNVPQYMYFCTLKAARYDQYAEYSIIDHQVFYRR